MMRKFLPFIIGGGLLLILVFWFFSIKNGAVRVNQEVIKNGEMLKLRTKEEMTLLEI